MLKKAFLLAVAAVILSLALSRFSPHLNLLHNQYTQEQSQYTVGEYRGMVAAFRAEESRPFQILYSYVAALPAGMADRLRSGIPARNEKELIQILEEFSS